MQCPPIRRAIGRESLAGPNELCHQVALPRQPRDANWRLNPSRLSSDRQGLPFDLEARRSILSKHLSPTLKPLHGDPMLETFRPLLNAAKGLDLSDPALAEARLRELLDPEGSEAQTLNSNLLELLKAGQIANRGELPVRWGRVAKAEPASDDFSIDVVHMSGPGPRHRHPNGEIDYCIALDGNPTFDGRQPGWVVMQPDSVHVPTVAGGSMLIVYLLPGGAMDFLG